MRLITVLAIIIVVFADAEARKPNKPKPKPQPKDGCPLFYNCFGEQIMPITLTVRDERV